jgi:hypothetical protein
MDEKGVQGVNEKIVEKQPEVKKENPDNQGFEELAPGSKKERALLMVMRILRALFIFFERWMIKSRRDRLARRMDNKR